MPYPQYMSDEELNRIIERQRVERHWQESQTRPKKLPPKKKKTPQDIAVERSEGFVSRFLPSGFEQLLRALGMR